MRLSKDSLLVVPVLRGEYNGMNLPGYIIETNGGYIWSNKPFKRLGKYEMDNLNQVSRKKYQIVTPINIIEFNPSRRINTSYPFNVYIQEVKMKGANTDNTHQKDLFVDSTIFFGGEQKIIRKLNYPQNTLTFTYASDSWAAYERNEYSYQLVGLEDTWSNWSREQKVL